MKILLVGLGYWGKIILKNLENMGKKDIALCDLTFKDSDKFQGYNAINNYKKVDADCVFITTPTSTHYEICKYFLEKKFRVF